MERATGPRSAGCFGPLRWHAVAASAALIAAVASGEIAPGEAHDIGRLLEVHLKTVELHDIEIRLAALEEKQP